MSGIAGIYHRDGRAADIGLLRRMTDIIAHRGPDGVDHWVNGAVGLGHCMLYTTAESLREQQPLTDARGELCLVMDGRVDNRAELRQDLEAKGLRLRSDTDAELVLLAYQCWGEECPARILGDFAFAIWDHRKRQLFCARDILGLKPFYYYADGGEFLFGSELRQFFVVPSIPRQANEEMIGEYLANAVTDTEQTLFRGICRLPPAHFLVVRSDRLRKVRYWEPDPQREIRYRSDENYADHFRDVFREAVRCRLRSHRPLGAYLSGGLDSSSVVGMAQSLYQSGSVAGRGLETFSAVFPGMACDESEYIRAVLGMWNVKSNERYPALADAAGLAASARMSKDFPDYPNSVMFNPLKALAQQKRMRILLDGSGGDEWLTGSFYHYADFLRHGRFRTLLQQFRSDRRFYNSDSEIAAVVFPNWSLLRLGVLPLVPRPLVQAARSLLRRDGVPRWIRRGFARQIQLAERLRREAPAPPFSSWAQRHMYRAGTDGRQVHSLEMEDRSAAGFHLEQRSPFHDRRVVEFGLAIPEDLRWRGEYTKFVLRRAMRNDLPAMVRDRLNKAEFSSVFARGGALQGDALFKSLVVAQMGWVDGDRVLEMYRRMKHCSERGDVASAFLTVPLWMIYGIELWFRAIFLDTTISPVPGPAAAAPAVPLA